MVNIPQGFISQKTLLCMQCEVGQFLESVASIKLDTHFWRQSSDTVSKEVLLDRDWTTGSGSTMKSLSRPSLYRQESKFTASSILERKRFSTELKVCIGRESWIFLFVKQRRALVKLSLAVIAFHTQWEVRTTSASASVASVACALAYFSAGI